LKLFLRKTNDTESIGIIFSKKILVQNNIFFRSGFFEDILFTLKHSIEINNKDCSTDSMEYIKKKNKNSITNSKNKLLPKILYKIKAWRQVDLYLKKLSSKTINYNKLLPDIQYRIKGEFFNELLKLKKSKLRPKSKSNFVRIITELLKKYVLKDFAVQTKKDLFIKKYLIN